MLRIPVDFMLGALGFFAGWTVGSCLVTLTGLPFEALWIAAGTGLGGAALGLTARNRMLKFLEDPALALPVLRYRAVASAASAPLIAAACGIAVAFASASYLFVAEALFWPIWSLLLVLGGFSVFGPRPPVSIAAIDAQPDASAPSSASRADQLALAALATAILLFYFFTSNPDQDDAFYLNLPVGMKLFDGPLLAFDTMLAARDWPLLGSNYKAESIPTLTAAISAATGVPVIYVAHAVLPVFWCLIFACALYIINYALFRERWLFGALMMVIASVAINGSLSSYGAYGVMRFFHGKAALITILIPMIIFIAYATYRNGAILGWAASAGLQICAVGATANAIYLAPLALGLVAAAGLFAPEARTAARWRALFLPGAAIYPIVIGLCLILFDPPASFESDDGYFVYASIWSSFLYKYLLALFFSTLLVGSLAGALHPRLRGATIYVLAFLVFVLNPMLWTPYGEYVTGGLNPRLMWAFPFPALLAIAIVWGASAARPRRAAVILAIAALLILAPGSALRTLDWGLAPIKVERPHYDAASAIAAATPPGGRILAPQALSVWLTTLEDPRPVVAAREDYLYLQRPRAPVADHAARRELFAWINGDSDPDLEDIRALLARLCVASVVVDRRAPRAAAREAAMPALGATFENVFAGRWAHFRRTVRPSTCEADGAQPARLTGSR